MKAEQFDTLINKLEEIRCGIIDVETNTESTSFDVNKLRDEFFNGLEFKTGWGRNEVKQLFEEVLEELN